MQNPIEQTEREYRNYGRPLLASLAGAMQQRHFLTAVFVRQSSNVFCGKSRRRNLNGLGRAKQLSGDMDSPCLGFLPSRRRGLGRNAGGFRTGGFRKCGGWVLKNAFP
jgi:hypothetical protein